LGKNTCAGAVDPVGTGLAASAAAGVAANSAAATIRNLERLVMRAA
jgi:hypothetical protein